jgi:hypothetical protein
MTLSSLLPAVQNIILHVPRFWFQSRLDSSPAPAPGRLCRWSAFFSLIQRSLCCVPVFTHLRGYPKAYEGLLGVQSRGFTHKTNKTSRFETLAVWIVGTFLARAGRPVDMARDIPSFVRDISLSQARRRLSMADTRCIDDDFEPHDDYREDIRPAFKPLVVLVGESNELPLRDRFAPAFQSIHSDVEAIVIPRLGRIEMSLAPHAFR